MPPGAVHSFGHATTVLGLACPLSMTPSAVIVLNVEPGGVLPVSARFSSPPPGPFATASMEPSLTLIATIADRLAWALSASSAAFCVFWSIVVLIGVPGLGWEANSSLSDSLSPCAILTDTPGEPPSTSSYRSWRPPWPTTSPTWYLPGFLSICSLVISPTRPSSAFAKGRVGARQRGLLGELDARQVVHLGFDLVVGRLPEGDHRDGRVRLRGPDLLARLLRSTPPVSSFTVCSAVSRALTTPSTPGFSVTLPGSICTLTTDCLLMIG